MKLLHASGFSAPEREAFRGFVFANMVGAMQSILTAMKEHNVSLAMQTNEASLTSLPNPCSLDTKNATF